MSGAARLRLVLVEDDVLDAELMQARIVAAGLAADLIRVSTREGFEAALADGCDLVLSDYNVPGFDGAEALAICREQRPDTPFVFVTGALGDERAIELLRRGAWDYVLKDRLERLVPSIQRTLREAHERRERQRAERARDESQRALVTLLNNVPGMAFRCRPTPPWTFEYASGGALELSGYQPEDFYDGGVITWSALMDPDDVDRVAAAAEAAFAERRQLTVEYRIRNRAGELKWIWDRSIGVYDQAGELAAIEGFAIDITQRRRQEEAVREAAEFEKYLIGIVSHDLRNPLNTIVLSAEHGLIRDDVDARTAKAFARIKSAGERAGRMIRDLLDFTQARLGAGIPIELAPVAMDEIVTQVVEEVATTYPDRVIRVHADAEVHGEWDRDRIGQAIGNLLTNALRYSPVDSPVTLRLVRTDDAAEVHIHNAGAPIADELVGRLFQPMQRGQVSADRTTRSVGLGLYIVDQIVRGHRGTIEVDSNAADGIWFRIRLPRRAQR